MKEIKALDLSYLTTCTGLIDDKFLCQFTVEPCSNCKSTIVYHGQTICLFTLEPCSVSVGTA